MAIHLRPSKIRYCQDTIGSRFSDRRLTLANTFRELLYGDIMVDDIECIEVVSWEGNWWTYTGNRRLYLYKRLEDLGIISHISVLKQKLIDPDIRHKWKFTTKCNGESIKCRQGGETTIKIDRLTDTWMKSRLYSICPSKIWFTKDFIENKFEDGRRTLPRTFSKLLHRDIDLDDMKQIKVFHRNRKWRVLDGNHRLYLYQKLAELGELLEIEVIVCSSEGHRARNLRTRISQPEAECDGRIDEIIEEWRDS